MVARAVYQLGEFCNDLELYHLEAELSSEFGVRSSFLLHLDAERLLGAINYKILKENVRPWTGNKHSERPTPNS